jgi:hypothetical protein
MGFKNMKASFTFADIALSTSMEKNRAIKGLEEINAISEAAMQKQSALNCVSRTVPLAYCRTVHLRAHLHNNGSRARFTTIIKNATDAFFMAVQPCGKRRIDTRVAFNLRRGTKVLAA